jgi:DNA-binding beta-propeller fold protein YncE
VLTFSARGMSPAGLAYDAASARVLVGDRRNRRIVTISERLKTSVDLVRAASAGFHDVLAIAIDERQGDLWVASATGAAADGAGPETSGAALHKLQLVSGRPLATIALETGDQPARPAGIAVSRSGAVFVLDGAAGRLWRLAPRERIPTLAATLDLREPSALAVADDASAAYVAHQEGLARVTLGNGAVAAVTPGAGVDLERLESLTWSRAGLLAVERRQDGARRVLRLRLSGRGTSITRVDVLDTDVRTCGGAGALTVSGDELYYLTAADEDEPSVSDCSLVVRRMKLR